MAPPLQSPYLVTEVMTAPPQKLQLLLIESAIRYVHLAQEMWDRQLDRQANEALANCQRVIGQVLAGLRRRVMPDLVDRVAGVYMFIFRSVVAAQVFRDRNKLTEALQVLELERDTWRQVCQQFSNPTGPAENEGPNGFSIAG